MKYFLGKKKFFLLFIFWFFVFIFSLLCGPVFNDDKHIEYSTRNIYLPRGLGYSVGSDAGNYLYLANYPKFFLRNKELLKKENLCLEMSV